MANTLTEVTPQLLAQGLLALRQNAIMPQLVNRQYDTMAGERGSTIDVPIPSAISVQTVAAANTPPSTSDISPTSVPIAMSEWKEAPFYLTDKDMLEVMEGTIPMQASEAIKALANDVDAYILGLHTDIYGYTGTAGTTPFGSSVVDATNLRKVLNNQLAPLDDRRVVMDADAEANALSLRAFNDMSFSGSNSGIINGELNRKFGFNWFMDQNVPTHSAGTASGATTDNAGYAAGATTIALASAGSGTIVVGDIITFAGDSQTYTVTSGDADVSNGGSITISPGLQTVIAASTTAITLKADHVVNLGFHRDAIAFASRPLSQMDSLANELGSRVQSAVDPISGLTLRLEITREHKRVRFSYDVLYGAAVIRPELGARLAG